MRRPDLTFQKAHAAVFVCLAVSAGFLVFNSCSHHPRYNVLLITLDTTRADHLACYGFHQIQTPALDSIAKEGVLFQRAYSVAPMTLPAHTSILSSTRPSYHSVIDNGDYRVPDQLNLLPKVLKSQGFSTAAFVSAAVLKKTFNLNQGFDVYNDEDIQDQPGLNMLVAERRGDLTTDAALKWLGSNSRKRWFVWVHYYDPHAAYNPPEPFHTRYESDEYSGEIAFMDSQVQRLLDFLTQHKLNDQTMVIALADHGESLGEHKEKSHSIFIYESTQHIPFLVRVPRLPAAGRQIVSIVSQVDVMPTVLDFLSIPIPAEAQGRSLKQLITGAEKDGATGQAFMESHYPYLHFGWSELFGLESGAYQFISAPKPELYDVSADRAELNNLADSNPNLVKELNFKIDEIKKASESRFGEQAGKDVQLDDQTRRQLEALGYAAGGAKPSRERAHTKNPQDLADIMEVLNAMQSDRVDGRYDELLRKSAEVLKRDPGNPLAVRLRADGYFGQGRYQEGIASLRAALAEYGDNADNYFLIGLSCIRLNKLEDAQAAFEVSLKLNPQKDSTRYYLARIYLAKNRVSDALKLIDEGKMRDTALGHLFMGMYLMNFPSMLEKARTEFEKAVKESPQSGLVRREYGQFMMRTDHPDKALEFFEMAEKLDPSFKVDAALQSFKAQARARMTR